MDFNRREFIRNMALGCGTIILTGNFGCALRFASASEEGKHVYSMILADYSKCAGCGTCEAVCSAFNHRVAVKGEVLPGSGNPYYSNIRVHRYNPDMDIPSVCVMCPDTPCIKSCPVEPDPKTGRKALYRDEKTGAIRSDFDRCIGCGSCEEACRTERGGVIFMNSDSKPERLCTLCDGDPQCVKYCPYGALSMVKVVPKGEFYGMHPDKIATELTKRWYNIQT